MHQLYDNNKGLEGCEIIGSVRNKQSKKVNWICIITIEQIYLKFEIYLFTWVVMIKL